MSHNIRLQDIISSIMNIDSIASLATTLDDMFKISIVIEQQVLPAVKNYVRGETSSDAFQNTTSLLSLSSALNATQLPEGYVIDPLNPPTPPAPAPDDNSSSDSSGLSSGQKLVRYFHSDEMLVLKIHYIRIKYLSSS